ncbi:type IV pilus modification PilV family protein [Photobacterium nomapromontoriensis]|uniref:type IV pilus modification PilV family protein n=1 Tax=Photobacterium nomapromontoriensis TaxID=2910237 RepID=UPI003D0FA1F6
MTARYRPLLGKRQSGFTLIEGIITIVILGIAMVTLTSFLFPQAERSATSYYQARAAAVGNAFLNAILARKFDEQSDPFGDSVVRCGEKGANPCTTPEASGRWPRDKVDAQGNSIEYFKYLDPQTNKQLGWGLVPGVANDVDDFHGCWGDFSLCGQRYNSQHYPWRGEVDNLLADDTANNDQYHNMTVRVDVTYDDGLKPQSDTGGDPHHHKRIVVDVDTGRYGQYDFVGYRSNY